MRTLLAVNIACGFAVGTAALVDSWLRRVDLEQHSEPGGRKHSTTKDISSSRRTWRYKGCWGSESSMGFSHGIAEGVSESTQKWHLLLRIYYPSYQGPVFYCTVPTRDAARDNPTVAYPRNPESPGFPGILKNSKTPGLTWSSWFLAFFDKILTLIINYKQFKIMTLLII